MTLTEWTASRKISNRLATLIRQGRATEDQVAEYERRDAEERAFCSLPLRSSRFATAKRPGSSPDPHPTGSNRHASCSPSGNDLHRAEQPRRRDGHLRHRGRLHRDDPRLPGADLREVTVFATHEQDDLGEDYGYRLHAKEVIGVALCDLDDPSPCRKSSTGIRRGRCSGGTSSKIGSASNDHR